MTKRKGNRESISGEMPVPAADRLEALRELFPEAFAEGKLDLAKFREAVGDIVDDRPERYSFTWAGKRDAIRLLQMPSRATLVPCPKESVNWDTTKNVFIEGDNLEVLKLLYKSYAGRVKLIYIDPPYNTGQDFIYPDNFADPLDTYLKLTGQKDTNGNLLTSNPETSGRYHSAWLSMMYPRLFLARQLLADDGAIFVSIDDHEVHDLRLLMNEVFGEENFVATVIWQKVYSPKNTARHFSEDHDYIVVYAKNASTWRPDLMPRTEAANARYENPDNDPRDVWKPGDLSARNFYGEGQYEVVSPSGKKFSPPKGRYWVVKKEEFDRLDKDNRIWWGEDGGNMPAQKRFLSEVKQGMVPQTLWKYQDVGHTQEAKKELLEFVAFENTDNVLDTVKPTRLLQRVLQIATTPNGNDIVLDFFAGSAPLGQAVMKQNREDGGSRQFITIQLPEQLPKPEKKLKTIADISRARLRQAVKKLRDDANGSIDFKDRETGEDLGIRCYKLTTSHHRQWTGAPDRDPASLANQMALFVDPLLPGWEPLPMIHEVALHEGYSLSCRVEELPNKTTKPNTVYRVTDPEKDQSFLICLDDKVRPGIAKALDLGKDDQFICRDVALTDEVAANLALQCRLKTI